jgi:hypothetical protein
MRRSSRVLLVSGTAITLVAAAAATTLTFSAVSDPPVSHALANAAGRTGDPTGGFEAGVSCGVLDDQDLQEVSGIVASARYPGMLWTHNDSGDGPGRIFLIDDHGRHRATVNLSGIENRDWEGIAIGPGPDSTSTESYLYIGDIGDNNGAYTDHYIYRLPEPVIDIDESSAVTVAVNSGLDVLRYRYDHGHPNAEALMIDPWTRDLYVISKKESHGNVYSIPYPQASEATVVAEEVGSVPFPEVVAADISFTGDEILVKNYGQVFYWQRDRGESVMTTLTHEPYLPPYDPEPQGEAIAFAHEGHGFYTLSENPDGKNRNKDEDRDTHDGEKHDQPSMPPLMFYKGRT